MNFLSKLLRGIAFVPAIVHGIEALFGGKTGNDKKEAALSFVTAALSLTEAVTRKEIMDESTANGAAGCFYDEWQRAPETGYQRHFFPWWFAEEYALDVAHALSRVQEDDRALPVCHSERSEESGSADCRQPTAEGPPAGAQFKPGVGLGGGSAVDRRPGCRLSLALEIRMPTPKP